MNVKLECEIVTPMFMAGADGNSPELRPRIQRHDAF